MILKSSLILILAVIGSISCLCNRDKNLDYGGPYNQNASYLFNATTNYQYCINYRFGPVSFKTGLSLEFTNSLINCANANLYVYNSAGSLIFNYCQKNIKLQVTDSYVTVQIDFVNPSNLVTYLSYFTYNPTTAPSTTTLAPTTTTTVKITTTTASGSVTTTAASSLFPDYTKCGIPAVQPNDVEMRIVNGVEAVKNSWPWQVLVYDGQYMCGGSLINNQWILTAAHCITSTLPKIYLGAHTWSDAERIVLAAKSIIHSEYDKTGNLENDIALIKLTSAVTFTNKTRPVCLPTSNNGTPGRVAMVTGWGDQGNGQTSNVLKQVAIPINNNSDCSPFSLTAKQICAGNMNLDRDSCQGDSGGPLVTKNGNNYVINGVVSYGGATCDGKGVYTNVYTYLDWITNTVKAN